ncbi:uncharacterized protein LOC110080981 isoform X2 [Pogona vitticeps]
MQGASFSSSFLELLDSLVRSIDPDQLPKISKKPRPSGSPVGPQDDDFSISGILPDGSRFDLSWETSESSSSFQDSETNDEFLLSLAPPPPSPPPPSPPPARAPPSPIIIPRLSLEVGRSELDDQLDEAERAIKELVTYWEHWSEADSDDVHQETNKTREWPRGHPLDLHDEYIREDPDYDEACVEGEALRDYEAEFREGRMPAAIDEADHPKENVDSLAGGSCVEGVSQEKPVASTSSVARLPCGKLVFLKKLSVCLRRLQSPVVRKQPDSSSDAGTASEREEAADLPRKKPRQRLHYGDVEMGAPNGNSRRACAPTEDLARGEMLEHGQKPTGGRADASSESSRSPTPEGRPSKPYPLRRRNETVRYAPGDEEEGKENSGEGSEGSSEEEWPGESEAEETEEAEERATRPAPARKARQRETLKNGSRHYRCPECGREFSNSSNMWKHLRIHKGEKPYGCHVCGKSFSDPSNFTKHQQQSHSGERHYQCSLCPKAYFLKSSLENHFRHHRGIRAFACLECESSFFSRAELLKHMNVHIFGKGGHRPQPALRCEECGKTYPSARLLRHHKRCHRRFECEICGQFFSRKYKYKFHLKCHEEPSAHAGVAGRHLSERRQQTAQRPKSSDARALSASPAAPSGGEDQLVGLARRPPESSGSSKPTGRPSCPEKSSVPFRPSVPMNGRGELPDPARASNPGRSSNSARGLTEPPQRRKPSALMFLGDKATGSAEPNLAPLQSQPLAPSVSETGPLRGSEGAEPLQTNQMVVARPQGPTWRTVPTSRLPEPETSLLPAQVVRASGAGPSGRGARPQTPFPIIVSVGSLASQGTIITNSSHLPSVGSAQNMPILWPSNSAQLLIPPSVTASVGPQPVAANRAQPCAEATSAFLVLSSPPMVPGPLASSNPGPLTLMVPPSGLCSASAPPGLNLVQQGAANGGLLLVSSATLPPGTKITLEIPAQKISLPAVQICPLCQARYFGEHNCKARHAEPVIRSEEDLSPFKWQNGEATTILQQLAVASQQSQPVVQLPPQNGGEPSSRKVREVHSEGICVDGKEGDDAFDREPSVTRSYNFREGRSRVTYVDREESSEVERDTDSDWRGEESSSSESEDDTVPPEKRRRLVSPSGGRDRARRRKGRYMCHICDKRLVYARSLKHHLRLHRAFSCNQCSASFISSDQLKRHKANHDDHFPPF